MNFVIKCTNKIGRNKILINKSDWFLYDEYRNVLRAILTSNMELSAKKAKNINKKNNKAKQNKTKTKTKKRNAKSIKVR